MTIEDIHYVPYFIMDDQLFALVDKNVSEHVSGA